MNTIKICIYNLLQGTYGIRLTELIYFELNFCTIRIIVEKKNVKMSL